MFIRHILEIGNKRMETLRPGKRVPPLLLRSRAD
jgi:hypothetical protein